MHVPLPNSYNPSHSPGQPPQYHTRSLFLSDADDRLPGSVLLHDDGSHCFLPSYSQTFQIDSFYHSSPERTSPDIYWQRICRTDIRLQTLSCFSKKYNVSYLASRNLCCSISRRSPNENACIFIRISLHTNVQASLNILCLSAS